MREIFYQAERVGTEFRGVAIDGKTFEQVLVTAHNYSDATVAKEAARRTYQEKQEMTA